MPDYELVKIIVITAVILLVCILAVGIIVRREKSKRKVRRMCRKEKIQLLEELVEPFGFSYVPREGVFNSREDAWQRTQGYGALFDKAAVGMNMVFDALPVYFEYGGKTWLIELWKGQYGIATGGEVGVYHANEIIPEIFYPAAHFEAASDNEMPFIQCRLDRKHKKVYFLQKRHWWLTGFCVGTFSRPSDLRLITTFMFDSQAMAMAFYKGLQRCGTKIPGNKYRICRNEVYVRMDFSPEISWPSRLHRAVVQAVNAVNCCLYRLVTYPFCCTEDRLLFLYFQIPGCFRRMLRRLGGRHGRC